MRREVNRRRPFVSDIDEASIIRNKGASLAFVLRRPVFAEVEQRGDQRMMMTV